MSKSLKPMRLSTRRPYQEMLARWMAQRDAVRGRRVKLGMVGYAYLCAMLRQQPCTSPELMARARLGHVSAYRFMMTLHTLKRVHICGWQLRDRRLVLPVFALGTGMDVPPPPRRPNGRHVDKVNTPRVRVCAGVLAFVNVLRAIEAPASRMEIEHDTGLNATTIQNALDALVGLNLAHIALWMGRPQGGPPLEQYQWGPGVNARKPVPDAAERRELLNRRAAQGRALRPLVRVLQDQPVAQALCNQSAP